MTSVRLLLAIFTPCDVHLPQNWGLDCHFEALNRSYLWFVKNSTQNANISVSFFLCNLVQKQTLVSFVFFVFFCIYLCVFRHNFCTNYITSRLIKHLKMTVWISVLWKIFTYVVAKKWPEMVVKWQVLKLKFSIFFFQNWNTHLPKQFVIYVIDFDPIRV